MISISAYRRYPQPQWYYRQTRSQQPPRPDPPPRAEPGGVREDTGRTPPPPPEPPGDKSGSHGGIAGALGSILPAGIDAGDIFLVAMLLFLYSESRDEEFLIILVVVGLSIFRKDKDK